MAEHPSEAMKQRDLSHLTIQEMSLLERAELYRRYTSFVAHFGAFPAAPRPGRKTRPWVPGERASADHDG